MKRITFILLEHMLATSVALPQEQLRAAEQMVRSTKRLREPLFEIVLATVDGAPVETHSGLTLAPNCALDAIAHSDISFLPALWRNPQPIIQRNKAVIPWLQKQDELGNIIAGVGTGCSFMAEAGLLDGRPATTHWYYFAEFARRYPHVNLQRERFITRSDHLFCAGSVNALGDLAVFFIAELLGEPIADAVERHFFHEVRKEVKRHTFTDDLQAHPDEDIAEAQAWMNERLAQPISVEDCAKALDMPMRTFNRRFKQATKLTPKQYLQDIRMAQAAELLKSTNLPVTEITYQSGYTDPTHFTRLFKRHLGVSPRDYRTTVRAKLFTA